MMNMKRVPNRKNAEAEHSANKYERLGRFLVVVFCLLWLIVLFATQKARAAELDCLVKPEMYVELSSPVDSVMEEILVETGDTVTRGQPLAKLEASVEKAKLELARLNAKSLSEIENRLLCC